MADLSKGEKTFRVVAGILLAVALLIPQGNILAWILVAVLIITGITGICPLVRFLKK